MSKKICVLLIILIMGVASATTGVYAASKVATSKSTKTVSSTNEISTQNAVNEVQVTSTPAVSNEAMAGTTENMSSSNQENNASKEENNTSNSSGLGLIAAALAIGLSAIGSGIAVAVVASSAVGAISENPSLLGKTVIFAGLAEGIAIYGLIIAIMIISKV